MQHTIFKKSKLLVEWFKPPYSFLLVRHHAKVNVCFHAGLINLLYTALLCFSKGVIISKLNIKATIHPFGLVLELRIPCV